MALLSLSECHFLTHVVLPRINSWHLDRCGRGKDNLLRVILAKWAQGSSTSPRSQSFDQNLGPYLTHRLGQESLPRVFVEYVKKLKVESCS